MKKVLITGGAGFIGSHLSEAYLTRGDEVTVIDDLSTGSLENVRFLESIDEAGTHFLFEHDTIFNHEKMDMLVRRSDCVVHLAAAVGVKYIIENPISSMDVNLKGTELILKLCSEHKKKVFIASTSEVYGKQSHAPLEETEDSVFGPSSKSRWSYAASKLIDEFYAIAYHRNRGLPAVVGRLFNTVGPRQTGQYGMVIPRFVESALNGDDITVFGDGNQTRTFTHVKEVVAAIMGLMNSAEANGEVVNIGGVEEVSILELAKRIKEKTGSSSEIRCIPYEETYPRDFEDMARRVPSTSKLRRLVGSAPKIELDHILDDVIEYYRNRT